MEKLTENQKYFAAALLTVPLTIKQLIERANNDGAYIERIHWRKIIALEIAKLDINELEEIVLSRGSRWSEFDDEYGANMVERGLSALSIQQELGQIFSSAAAE